MIHINAISKLYIAIQYHDDAQTYLQIFQCSGPRGYSCHFFKWKGRWKFDSKVDSITFLTVYSVIWSNQDSLHQLYWTLMIPGGKKEPFCNRWASWSSWCSWSPSTGLTAPSTSMDPACSHNLGQLTQNTIFTRRLTPNAINCEVPISQFHVLTCCESSFLISRHLHQVLYVTATTCMCNTSWTAFWLRYRPPNYDGTFTFLFQK